MSRDVAYHLRTNKNVERALFAELLRRLSPHLPSRTREYDYVGLGGPHLEDFASVQTVFGCKRMTSLETEPHVQIRQRFNLPNCRVRPRLKSTTDFVSGYETGKKPLLVWFDYTKHDWKDQIQECCELLVNLPHFSILKISLVCVPKYLYAAAPNQDPLQGRLQRLNELFADFGPFGADDVREARFHLTLFRIFVRAVAAVIKDSPKFACRSLAAYHYSDRTPMLTITAMVGPAARIRRIIAESDLANWPFARLAWRHPLGIDVPDFSLRERLAVDRLLPDASATSIHHRLRLRFDPNIAKSREVLSHYIRFARHVPHFVKIQT